MLTPWDLISASAKLVTRVMVKHALVSNKVFHVFTKKILPFISDNLNSLSRKVCFVPGERKVLHFLYFNLLNTDTPLIHMDTFYDPLSVWIDGV